MIKIGTSGYSFKDWRGAVYPENLKQGDILIYYQKTLGFDCVEINSTYYTLVSQRSFEGMEGKTAPGFVFVVKGYRGITHDPFDIRLKENKPDIEKAKDSIERFHYSIEPLKKKGKLGAVLLQFPPFFYPCSQSREYISLCKDMFGDTPLIIEFRNRAWAKEQTFAFLREKGLGYCAVDEPHLPRLMPFINRVTSDIGYVRLHGRNANWFNAGADERYNYLYTEKELEGFLPELSDMESKAKKTYVFFNNCHAGFAVKNALMLLGMLNQKRN